VCECHKDKLENKHYKSELEKYPKVVLGIFNIQKELKRASNP